MDELLKKNLDNIEPLQYMLDGTKVDKLAMKDRIGFLPLSIWEPDWSIVKRLKSIIGDNGDTRVISKDSKIYRTGGRFGNSTKESEINSQASLFNPHLAQMILSAYCPQGANIYDPFAGGGTRGFIASAMGYNYTGREIRKEEVTRIVAKQNELDKHFLIFNEDAQNPTSLKNYYDFSYTCPPYFNLEIYSDLESDLSNAKSYPDFLLMLKRVLASVYDSLKKNSLSIWVVGNFRDNKGNLVHFNGDLIRLGIDIGFALHDEIVFWGASKCASQRVCNFEANRKSVRVHEYIVIFKKY